jgi:hypothetical protein
MIELIILGLGIPCVFYLSFLSLGFHDWLHDRLVRGVSQRTGMSETEIRQKIPDWVTYRLPYMLSLKNRRDVEDFAAIIRFYERHPWILVV